MIRKTRRWKPKVKKKIRNIRTRRGSRPDRAKAPRPVDELHEGDELNSMHWLTAGLFVAAGAEAALGERRGDYRPDPVRWAPLIAAPIAGAAQAARALWPSRTTRMVAQLANGVALGVGAAGLASSINSSRTAHEFDEDDPRSIVERMPSLAPLAFGAVGLLAMLLDSDEPRKPRKPALVIRV